MIILSLSSITAVQRMNYFITSHQTQKCYNRGGRCLWDKRSIFERGRLCDYLRYLVLINWCGIRTLLIHTSYIHICETLHFLKIFSQIPRDLSDSRKFLETESPYIHRVSAPVKDEFSTAAVVLSSIENSYIVVHEIIKNTLYRTHAF